MDIIEELKKEPISSNYFNLLGSLTNYSGHAFEMEGVLEMTVQKLKEAYPNLSDKECSAICHPFLMTGEGYRIRDFIIVEDTLLEFINDEHNLHLYSNYLRVCKFDEEKKFYRNIISYDFFYNFEENHYKNGKVNNPNDTGLSRVEEKNYSHFFGHAFNSFLEDQGININILPNHDQMEKNGETFPFVIKDLSFMRQDYSIFVDCNFINLARSFAKKQDFSINILICKAKSLEMAATLSQTFDEYDGCKIELRSIELPYFSLNKGYQTTTVKNDKENISFYSLFSKKKNFPQKKREIEDKNKTNSITIVEKGFPYNAILIDSDKKDLLIKEFPVLINLPVLEIPSFDSSDEMLAFLREKIRNYQTMNQGPLLISANPNLITAFHLLNLDTCFINSGLNDTESYQTTYEVSCLEKIKQIHLKAKK